MSRLAGVDRFSDEVPRTGVRFDLRRYPCATDAAAHEAGVAFPRMREAVARNWPCCNSGARRNNLEHARRQLRSRLRKHCRADDP